MTTLRELVTLLGFKVDDAGVQKADAAFGRLQGKANDLMNLVSAASFAYLTRITGKLSDSLGVAVDLAAAEEDAWHSLMITTEQMGGIWADIQPRAEAFTKTMMKTTRFADDEAIAALQTYIQMTSDIAGSYKAVALAADVATGKHWSLEAATLAVGFAQAGNLRRLIPLLPEFKNLAEMDIILSDYSERAAYAMGLLNEKFGGQALKALGTYTSATKQLKNWQQELGETIGDKMVKPLESLYLALIPVTQKMAEFINQHKTLVGTAALGGFAVGKILPGLGELVQTLALTKLAFPGILAGIAGLGKAAPVVGLVAAGIYVVAASIDHLWQVFSSGGDVMKNLGAALWNIIRGPINIFLAAVGLLNAGLNSLLSMVGIKFKFALPKLMGTKDYDLPEGATIKGPGERFDDLMKWVERAIKPPEFYGPPAPPGEAFAPPKARGKPREEFHALLREWNESMFATHPVGAMAGGGTFSPTANVTVNVTVPPGTMKEQAEYIASRSSEAARDEINKMLKHTSDNFPER